MPYVETGLKIRLLAFVPVASDGAIYFFIKDMVIHPEYQRKGLARALTFA